MNRTVTKTEKNNAIDMLIALIVNELAADLRMDADEVFSKFASSKTGESLYDEESKLWWSGPSDIAELFKAEMHQKQGA